MNLRDHIKTYITIYQEEIEFKTQMLEFLDNCEHPFSRDFKTGHFTGSAFLLNCDKTKFLLMRHSKLNKWVQPGGHCDGNNNILEVAIKEAREESGIYDIEPISKEIYDINICLSHKSTQEPVHYHYDIRFLLKTINNDSFTKNLESKKLKWIEFFSYNSKILMLDNSVRRMIDKFIKYH